MQMCMIFTGMFLAYLAAPILFSRFGLAPVIVVSGAASLLSGLVGLGFFIWRRSAASAA
jgi:hypothetical protein